METHNTLHPSPVLPLDLNSPNVFPSSDAEKVIVALARSFDAMIEVSLLFIGNDPRKLNLVVRPEYLLGVKGDEKDLNSRRRLTRLLGAKGTKAFTRFGVEENIKTKAREFGVQIVASNEEFPEAVVDFIPKRELALDRQLVKLLPTKLIKKLFPKKNPGDVTDEDIEKIIVDKNELVKLPQPYFYGHKEAQTMVTYLQDYLMRVDILASGRSLWPTREHMKHVLSPMNNLFKEGRFYGFTHIHYSWTKEQMDDNADLSEARSIDPLFYELISPQDAAQMFKDEGSMAGLGLIAREGSQR